MMDADIAQNFKMLQGELTQIRKTLETLARVEERLAHTTHRMVRFEFRLDEYERETEADRIKAVSANHSIKTYERVTWAVFAAALSVASIYLTK